MSSVYDDFFATLEEEEQNEPSPYEGFFEQQDSELRQSVGTAVRQNPDQYAKDLEISNKSGYTVNGVKANRDKIETESKYEGFDFDAAARQQPNIGEFFREDINNAILAQDDVENLKKLDQAINGPVIGDTVNRAAAAFTTGSMNVTQFILNVPNTLQRWRGAIHDGIENLTGLDASDSILFGNFFIDKLAEATDPASEFVGESIDLSNTEFKPFRDNVESAKAGDEAFNQALKGDFSGVASIATDPRAMGGFIGQALPSLLLALGSRGNVFFTGAMEAMEVSTNAKEYEERTGQKISNADFVQAQLQVGIINGLLERIVPKAFLEGKAGESFLKILLTAAQEAMTEGLQAFNTNLAEMFSFNRDKNLTEGVLPGMLGGSGTGATVSTAQYAAGKVQQYQRRNESKAIQDQRRINQIAESAKESKLLKRNKDRFKEFIRKSDGDKDTHVYFDPVQTDLFLQDKTDDEIAADPALTLLAAAIREASGVETVQIPLADFAADLATSEHFESLRPHMTLDPESITPFRQQEMRERFDTYMKALVAEASQHESQYAEARDVFEQVRAQLVDSGAVNPANAKVMAELVPAWATARAAKTGQTVREVYERSGLTIEGPQTGRAALGEETTVEGDLSLLPESLISEFPTFPQTAEGVIAITNLRPEEKQALRDAGLVERTQGEREDGESFDYESVKPESLWRERERRQNEPKTKQQVDSTEVRNAVQRRIDGYKRQLQQEEEKGELASDDLIDGLKKRIKRDEERLSKTETDDDILEQPLSTRLPTGKNTTEDPLVEVLHINNEVMRSDPKSLEKNINEIAKSPDIPDISDLSLEGKLETMIEQFVENLLFLHDEMPAEMRDRAKLWYEGGRRTAEAWGERYGLSEMQVTSVIAVLSPQNDWYTNMSQAERIMDAVFGATDYVWDENMDAHAQKFIDAKEQQRVNVVEEANKRIASEQVKLEKLKKEKEKLKQGSAIDRKQAEITAVEKQIRKHNITIDTVERNTRDFIVPMEAAKGKSLREILDQPDVAARWIRMYDEIKNNRGYKVLKPEGGVADTELSKTGEPKILRWKSYLTIAKAVSILRDGRAENVHYQLGENHKVRNFYNNLFDPNSPYGFTTIDTHAVGAAHFRALSADSKEANMAFGKAGSSSSQETGLKGTYAIYFEAYRRAAEARGLQPRQMQSITWEAARGLFPTSEKRRLTPLVNEIWAQYANGDIDRDEARARVMDIAGGVKPPAWVGTPRDETPGTTYTGPAQQNIVPGTESTGEARVDFEVAPNPNDTELVAQWKELSDDEQLRISQSIAAEIVPQVLNELSTVGNFLNQFGGYLGDTNPSFVLKIDRGEVGVQAAKILGHVLRQEAMVVTSDQPFLGGELTGLVTVNLPEGYGRKEVTELYNKLYELEFNGKKVVGGHSTAEDKMAIMNFIDGLSTDDLAKMIEDKIGSEFFVETSEIYSTFVTEYGYDNSEQEGATATRRSSTQRRVDSLRRQATSRLEEEITGATGTEAGVRRRADQARGGNGEIQAQETDTSRALGDHGGGSAFADFFGSVTSGEHGKVKEGAVYKPVIKSFVKRAKKAGSRMAEFMSNYIKHVGNFDSHIKHSIPGYGEVQPMLGAAIANVYGGQSANMLDIGASEGSFVKTISEISDVQTIALDTSPNMRNQYDKTPVEGSTFVRQAFGPAELVGENLWIEKDDDGGEHDVFVYDPTGKQFDIINEAMVFQFIANERDAQIAIVKQMLAPDGVFVTQEKMKEHDPAVEKAAEVKKNEFKLQYFEKDALDEKAVKVIEGMRENMEFSTEYEAILKKHFNYVVQFWDSGNFKGWVATDVKEKADALVAEIGDTSSEFSTVKTPRQADDTVYQQSATVEEQKNARGYFDAANTVIRLTETSDLSTFMHEFAHFMYEMERNGDTGLLSSINNWFKRNADAVAKEANTYYDQEAAEAESFLQDELPEPVPNFSWESDIPIFDSYFTAPIGKDYFHQQKGYKVERVVMTPDEYIAAASAGFGKTTTEIMEQRQGEITKEYTKAMQAGDVFPALTLDYFNGFSQEGLHRAIAAKEAGLTQVPVLVRSESNDSLTLAQDELPGDTGIENGVQVRPPVNNGQITVTHYSTKKGLTEIDPVHWGTNYSRGAEADRRTDKDWVDRSYFGIAPEQVDIGGYKKEPHVGQNRYDMQIPADKLYDMANNPDGLPNKNKSSYEKAINDAGYTGYWVKHPTLGLVGAAFEPLTPVDNLAQDEDLPGQAAGPITAADINTYLDGGTTGNSFKDKAIRRAVHEQFARGFETYMMEGKAPSIELRNVFRTMARMIVDVYRRIRGDLQVNLDDEMRQVFDRLLATEEQIAAAEARNQYEPLFTDAAMAGMTEAEFAKYQEREQKIQDKQTETLRDKVIGALTRQTKRWWQLEKQDVIDEITPEIEEKRVHLARKRLRGDEIKLDRAAVKEMAGQDATVLGRKFTRVPGQLNNMTITGGEGIHPDDAAALLGYSSGSEMLNDMITAPTLKAEIDETAEQVMLERHGDPFTDGTIERAADEAVHNDERGKRMLVELKHLAKGTRTPVLDRMTIKDIAFNRIGELTFRQIQPNRYKRAEVNARGEASRMMAEGNTTGAAEAKLREIMNHYLFMAATDARDNTTRIIDDMARYRKKKVRENIMKAGNEYWGQIEKILSRFEFRKSASLASVSNINTWMITQNEEHGDGLVLSPEVLNEGYLQHWKNIPYSELQGVADSVKNIEHVARYSNKMNQLEEEMEYQALKQKWVDHIGQQKTRFTSKDMRGIYADVERPGIIRQWASQLTKVPFLASWLDGGERAGLSHDILMQPFTDALDMKMKLLDEVARPVLELILNRSNEDLSRHKRLIWIEELGESIRGDQVIATALNTGNQSNLKKLLLGEGWATPENDAEISINNEKLQAVLEHMTEADWQLVQKVWDQMELLYPQLAEVHRRTTGLTPPKVESTPVETPYGTFKGGYYPVKYSRRRSHKAEQNAQKVEAEAESMFNNTASIQASVNAGATNERTGFYDRIDLRLDVIPDHFMETIHYISHHDAVRQTNRLIRDNDIANAITKVVGEDEFNQLKGWLNDIAKDGRNQPVKTYIDTVFGRLRFGTTLGIMGFKASTGVMQLFGLMTTAAELGVGPTLKAIHLTIGRSWYMNAIRKTLGSTQDMQTAWDFAAERSKVMPHRVETMDREIRAARERLRGKTGLAAGVQEASMKHIALIQTYMVDLPTWHAAYMKELSETGDEQKAIKRADWSVEILQGSGATKDMSTILRNQSKLLTTMTMFMTFFSSLGNLSRDLVKGSRSGRYSVTNTAAKMMFLFMLPVFLEMLMRGDLDEPEWEEEDDRLSRYLTQTALYPLTAVPFFRDAASAIGTDYGYNASPVASMLERGLQGSKQIINRSYTDKDITKGAIESTVKLGAAALGIPGTNQVWNTGEHLWDIMENGEKMTARELILFGPDRE